ncbi:hypothetical protein DL769_001285 [Monosporascus sp. CRB-8-3]|nr:hypothetical protein DL769_001285 [Monosporascus sp. CRB-8-3]
MLIGWFWDYDCTDTRDKIYGLLSLSSDYILVDYDKSVEDIVEDVLQYTIISTAEITNRAIAERLGNLLSKTLKVPLPTILRTIDRFFRIATPTPAEGTVVLARPLSLNSLVSALQSAIRTPGGPFKIPVSSHDTTSSTFRSPFACPRIQNGSSNLRHKRACTRPSRPSISRLGQAYREMLRNEVTQRVRETLEARFDQIEDSLKIDFVDMVRNALGDALKQHSDPRRSSHQGSAKTQQVDPAISGASQATAVAGAGTSFAEDPIFLFDFHNDFDISPMLMTSVSDPSQLCYTSQVVV